MHLSSIRMGTVGMAVKHRALVAALGVSTALVLAGCGATAQTSSTATQASAGSTTPVAVQHAADSGEGSYLAADSGAVAFIRWTVDESGALSGIYDYAESNANSASGTSSHEVTVTGTRHGLA
jgi:hypothetical protein